MSFTYPVEQYQHAQLPSPTSFRIAELLPGREGDAVRCLLHNMNWDEHPEYEAVSYAWGDPKVKAPVICHGTRLDVTENLQSGLVHLRREDRSRFLWMDAVCIDQKNLQERSLQVKQMRRVYENAKAVLIWLGPDTEDRQADTAVDAIRTISDLILKKLDMSISDLSPVKSLYQEVLFNNRSRLPPLDAGDLRGDVMWKALIWLYSHSYFTRIWAIQEVNANSVRAVHFGQRQMEWHLLELVAGYIILETASSKALGFTGTRCWWAANVATERFSAPKNWIFMLYLASNFNATDSRDFIYGLRGLMSTNHDSRLLHPDYTKSDIEVYRDSVEAAFEDFGNVDVLLYAGQDDQQSWIPRWNRPMLFRNPFRFGKPAPWKPAGESRPVWHMDRRMNTLHLSGFLVDSIKFAETYNERYFGNTMLKSDEGRLTLKNFWQGILSYSQSLVPPSTDNLSAIAASFSFGLDEESNVADERILRQNFLAYLRIVLDEDTYNQQIPLHVSVESKNGDGYAFGKPVWDFEYPDSSFFVTEEGLVGCTSATTRTGDVVFVAHGSTFAFVLRPEGEHFRLRGYAFIPGIMHGEWCSSMERRQDTVKLI